MLKAGGSFSRAILNGEFEIDPTRLRTRDPSTTTESTMSSDARRIVSLCPPASPWPRGETHSRQESITPADATKASRVRQIVEAVGRNISFDSTELPKEFFPAHLSIAIIEAVFRFQPGQEEQSSQIAKRYCRHFGLTHRRRNMFELPPVDEQETVANLIGHYDERGVKGMANEVFETSCRLPGTATCRAESVLHIAKALRHIGVDALQDVQNRPAQELEEALRSVPGMDGSMARLVLTYAGDDDFVVGDDHVRRFVAEATGQRTVSASCAAYLVSQAAYESVRSPRHLDYRIYCYGAGR